MWLSIGEWLLENRWLLAGTASLGVFVFESIEYKPLSHGLSTNFLFEIGFYGVILPLAVGIALSWAAVSRKELAWSTYYQDLISNMGIQLHNTHSHNELATVLLQFVRVVMPIVGATVYKYDERSRKYTLVQSWCVDKRLEMSDSIRACSAENCPLWHINETGDRAALRPCLDAEAVGSSTTSPRYCIPYFFDGAPVGAARFHVSSGSTPSPEHQRFLKETAPLISSVFQRIQLERLMKKQGDSVNVEQQRIARDVHDSLGHSLAYLRLRLDHISMEFDQTKQSNLQVEVEALRDVAKEAYDQMRDVLTVLTLPNEITLDKALLDYTDRINRRGPLRLSTHHEGSPQPLAASVQRNVFHIFQEILTNIEKHAQAREVEVNLKWQETGLEIEVFDDGIGFDLTKAVPNGHFGLKNIRERALEINAQLHITSESGQGTCLKLWIPYKDAS